MKQWRVVILLAFGLILNSTAVGQSDHALIGRWVREESIQTVELLFRSDGRYRLEKKSTNTGFDYSSSERGHYQVEDQVISLTPYDYLVNPQPRSYQLELTGDTLSLTGLDFGLKESFQFQPGSTADVLAQEDVNPNLVRIWRRHIQYYGHVDYTFRPGGYYEIKRIPDNTQFAPIYIRGLYEQNGNQLTFKPYNQPEEVHEMDFFGNELTLIKLNGLFGESVTLEGVPGSENEVLMKSAEAEAFLARTNWPVGAWEIRQTSLTLDLILRPDGRYAAERDTGFNKEVVRGRYLLDSKHIQLIPYIGQGVYSQNGSEFGILEHTRELDYYDGELQIIDPESLVQSVTIARKRPGSDEAVAEAWRQAQAEQAREGWCVGIWQVKDGTGWMEFTFRPDQRYIAKAGMGEAAKEVERGRYRLGANKLTLASYQNLEKPRGFEIDFYDGVWLMIGDPVRMVAARKIPGSEVTVIQGAIEPEALKGARGPLVGLWSMPLDKDYSAELLFRPDGQFRLARCEKGTLSLEYGLYSLNLASHTLSLDSRLADRVKAELDFYDHTMTLVSTNQGFPATYVINPNETEAVLLASLAADNLEADLDALWFNRVSVGPRNPEVGQTPPLPTDLRPEHVFEAATVFTEYRHYQRLISSFVHSEHGSIPVMNSQEWHFLRNGRVMIRFIQYRLAHNAPIAVPEIITMWGAYGIEPKPDLQDILHFYADHVLRIETDLGEPLELTLEDGRRHLFWGTSRAILDEWAAELPPFLCQPPAQVDPNLWNTGVSLRTTITPDDFPEMGLIRFSLARSIDGNLAIQGRLTSPATLVTEQATSLIPPVQWQAMQTNIVPEGPFNIALPASTYVQAYYRLRRK